MSKTKRTPGPWERFDADSLEVVAADGHTVAQVYQCGGIREINEADANVDLIVRAVNSHEALIAVLKRCLQEMRAASELLEMFPDDYGDAINAADALLVKVDPLYAELDAKLKAARAALAEGESNA